MRQIAITTMDLILDKAEKKRDLGVRHPWRTRTNKGTPCHQSGPTGYTIYRCIIVNYRKVCLYKGTKGGELKITCASGARGLGHGNMSIMGRDRSERKRPHREGDHLPKRTATGKLRDPTSRNLRESKTEHGRFLLSGKRKNFRSGKTN